MNDVGFKVINHCEECEKETDKYNILCDECQEYYFCECGQKLEDAAGSPGDGFCARCR